MNYICNCSLNQCFSTEAYGPTESRNFFKVVAEVYKIAKCSNGHYNFVY